MIDFNVEKFRAKPLPTEQEIMAGWIGDFSLPVVSVVCVAFNQEKYIKDALRGFLIQKTNFPFEIIVHDDASSDGTPEILRDYRQKYPNIIRLVLQSENQYRQGKKIFPMAASYALGSYIASCEGDDFWIAEDKLQNQKNIFDQNDNCALVIHRCLRMKKGRVDAKPSMGHGVVQRDIEMAEIVGGACQFAPTASYFMKREVLGSLPSWINSAPVGDYFIECYSYKVGSVAYLPDVYSVYRVNATGSWSKDVSRDGHKQCQFSLRMYESLRLMSKDAFFQGGDIEKKMAASMYGAAMGYLFMKKYSGYRECIGASWELCPKLSTSQSILYFFKGAPCISRAVLLAYKKAKSI